MFGDARGFFCERFRVDEFKEAGLPHEFKQDNFSRSAPGVLRGLHFQYERPQGKLVTAVRGAILDVIVDLRTQSPTFGHHLRVELTGDRPEWLWVPPGFAHGFYVLPGETADIAYKVDQFYNPQGEGGILWNDQDLRIEWPISEPNLSERDKRLPKFSDYRSNPLF